MKAKLLIAFAGAAALAASACTAQDRDRDASVEPVPWVPASAQLTTFDGCDEALEGIQDAVIASLAGWEDHPMFRGGVEPLAVEQEEAAAADGAASDSAGGGAIPGSFSETNNAVSGVDEPDIVKTDGTFIYSVAGYALRTVDARSQEVAAERELDDSDWGHRLFLADGSLFLMYTSSTGDGSATEFVIERLDPSTLETYDSLDMEGAMLDARLVGGELRLVVSSSPDVEPLWDVLYGEDPDQDDLEAAVRDTAIEDWLPEYAVNGEEQEADCGRVAHPERFTGSSVTVFALPAGGGWDRIEPSTVMADGGTVHGTPDSLYIGHYDSVWDGEAAEAETELYRFVFEDGSPRLAGEATVPGSLLNQYSLSEYGGHLRVATTEDSASWGWWGGCGFASCAEDFAPAPDEPSRSTVTVFAVGEDSLTETGSVTGLGVDERIFAVRFIGDTGYVVTFRQTDPLYSIDLSDPANPVVTGELKITGYSAYLHPVGEDRLLGVGQEATEDGAVTGLQVSLFDTASPEAAVLDQYERPDANAAVEWDPHAFLYWEDEGLVALPATEWGSGGGDWGSGVLVLAVGPDSLTESAWIEQDADDPYAGEVQRAFVVGGRLWTLSAAGLQANELGGDFEETAWIGF